jgi:hypothetical protein
VPGTEDFSKFDDQCLEGFLICHFGRAKLGGLLPNKNAGVQENRRIRHGGRAMITRGYELWEQIGKPDPTKMSEGVAQPEGVVEPIEIPLPKGILIWLNHFVSRPATFLS